MLTSMQAIYSPPPQHQAGGHCQFGLRKLSIRKPRKGMKMIGAGCLVRREAIPEMQMRAGVVQVHPSGCVVLIAGGGLESSGTVFQFESGGANRIPRGQASAELLGCWRCPAYFKARLVPLMSATKSFHLVVFLSMLSLQGPSQ